jgi:hypothetical protein
MSDRLYRTTELDYDSRRKPKTNRSCVRCQRDIKPFSPARSVHVIDGGISILHPEDEDKYVPDGDDCGAFLVGMDCARLIGMEWTTEG